MPRRDRQIGSFDMHDSPSIYGDLLVLFEAGSYRRGMHIDSINSLNPPINTEQDPLGSSAAPKSQNPTGCSVKTRCRDMEITYAWEVPDLIFAAYFRREESRRRRTDKKLQLLRKASGSMPNRVGL